MEPTTQLARDAQLRPELFRWNGPLHRERITDWAEALGTAVPEDLLSLWAWTGGGELFETGTLLSPFGDASLGDDVAGATRLHRERGLPREWVLFHFGSGLSAFDSKGRFAWFAPRSYAPSRLFETLNEWYSQVLRAEYAGRYGLR